MDNKLIEEALKRTRKAVNAAKAKGEKSLLFLTLYYSWSNIDLADDEKDELKRRFVAEGWTLQDEYVNGVPDWKSEQKIVLRF
jgi:hypothetical protein